MSLIKLMLFKNPRKRYSNLYTIKTHPYFNNFDWDGLTDLTLEPCYKIKMESISNKEITGLENYIYVKPLEYFEKQNNKKDSNYYLEVNNWFNSI